MFDTASDISPSGAKCEVDIDECDSAPCQNGGLCKDGMEDFQCQCRPGYLGKAQKECQILWISANRKLNGFKGGYC